MTTTSPATNPLPRTPAASSWETPVDLAQTAPLRETPPRRAQAWAGAASRWASAALLALLVLAPALPAGAQAPQLRTRLPIVVIDAAGVIVDERDTPARMRIIHSPGGGLNSPAGRPNVYDGRIEIELRGQSSLRFPKKQFAVETVTASGENRDVPLLGLPEENDWVLSAGYNDGTLLRNVVAYRAAREIGRYASRTRFVELVLNGRYHGVYVLME